MKNKIGALALLLASTLVATGCSSDSVKYSEDENGKSIIYTIKTEDGVTKNFTADDLLKELVDTASGQTAVYNEVAKQVFTIAAEKQLTKAEIEEMEADAVDKVDEFKENAKTEAKASGVDYDTYLETALENEGVDSLDELQKLYVYQAKKDSLLEDYVEEHYDYFLKKYLDLYTPFQVKHILVAANTSDTNFNDGTMTPDNARKLLKILNRFVTGESFAQIADDTDDTSTKNTGGILPFDQSANYVSEFRFAPYILAVYSKTGEERLAMAKKLHLIDEDGTQEDLDNLYINDIYKDGIDTVSLDDIFVLEEKVKSTDKGGNLFFNEDGVTPKPGVDVPTYAEQIYPSSDIGNDEPGNNLYFDEYELKRNEIFNSTLNTHQVKYIEVGSKKSVAENATATVVTKNGQKEVLADDQGNPIFVVYASTGIHFMVNVWDSAEKTDEENASYFTITGDETKDNIWEGTYVALNNPSESKIEDNVDALLTIIETFASPLEQYVFYDLVYGEESTITIEYSSALGEEIAEKVEKYVVDTIEASGETYIDTFRDALKTYGLKLQREQEVKNK